jgi:hypothetical protein
LGNAFYASDGNVLGGLGRLARRHLLSLRLGDASILDGLRQCCRLSGCLRRL